MATGKIKWFNHQIGAGFIRSDAGENIFFRCNALHGANPQAIRNGQAVHFDIAKNIRSLTLTADHVITADCRVWEKSCARTTDCDIMTLPTSDQ